MARCKTGRRLQWGKVGQAFSFDGANDYVSIPHNASLQPTQITVSVWMKANPVQSYTHYLIVDKSHGWVDATGWVLQGKSSTGRIAFSYGNGVDFPEFYSTTNVLDNNWHFVTGTLDGSDLKIYVDGILEGFLPYSGTPAGNIRSVNIGASWGGGTFNRFFNGLIDEVDIYNRALSASEIQSIYNAGSAGTCQPPPPSCANPPSGLVSWWPGDGNANDIQDGNNGATQNGATFATGKVGQAFSLDGVDDYVEVPDSPSLTPPSSSITLEAWVKPDAVNGNYVIISKYNSNNPSVNGVSWYLGLDTIIGPGHLRFAIYQNPAVSIARTIDTNNPVLSAGVWQHVAATFDLATQEMKIYVNGVEVPNTLDPTSSIMTSIADSNTPVRIGVAVHVAGNFANFWDGLIDEAGIYNRALSASEIQSIYNAGSAGKCQTLPVCVTPPSGLISWWPGDDNANDIKDGNNGTLVNGATFAAGKVGQAFSFDGVNDYLEIPENGSLDLSGDFTLETWIKPEAYSVVPSPVITKYNYSGGNLANVSWQLDILNDGNVQFGVACGTNSSTELMYQQTTNTVVSLNVFTHLAAVYRQNPPAMEIYVNGVLQAGTTNGSCSFINQNDTPVQIGKRIDSGSTAFFDGIIDEASIYNRALSASEIQSIYNAGSAGKCKECEPPTVDAGEDQTICPGASVQIGGDQTGSGGTGTLTFSWEPIDGLSDATAANPTATPASTTTYTVTVTDANECAATDEVTVTVEDNQAPVITVAATPIALWPPNHQFVTINASQCVVAVSDNCAGLSASNVIIAQVTSDEPEDAQGGGDGNTLNDMVIASDCQSVQLRSERQGSGNGRVHHSFVGQ